MDSSTCPIRSELRGNNGKQCQQACLASVDKERQAGHAARALSLWFRCMLFWRRPQPSAKPVTLQGSLLLSHSSSGLRPGLVGFSSTMHPKELKNPLFTHSSLPYSSSFSGSPSVPWFGIVQAGPPPPYDSIIASDGPNQFFGSGFPPLQEFEIVVSDPIKQGEGVGAHVTYKVRLVCSSYLTPPRRHMPDSACHWSVVMHRQYDCTNHPCYLVPSPIMVCAQHVQTQLQQVVSE